MNDPRDPRTRLLAETLQGDWENGPVSRLAAAAAGQARWRRRRRHALAGLGSVATLALVALLWLPPRPAPPAAAPAPVTLAPPAYEILTDEQLLAELHDRPLLSVGGPDGAPRIVVLAN